MKFLLALAIKNVQKFCSSTYLWSGIGVDTSVLMIMKITLVVVYPLNIRYGMQRLLYSAKAK